MSYHRPLSPGGRRIVNPARASDSLADPYYTRHSSIASPRASTGVIPISTQTFINIPPPAGTRTLDPRNDRLDVYSGRPRRSSFIEPSRGSVSSSHLTTRGESSRDRDYYIPPPSKEPRKVEHKKVYSVGDGNVKLVADVDIPVTSERPYRRHESIGEKIPYRSAGTERDAGRHGRTHHTNGTYIRGRERSIDDDGAYSYIDAAGMFRDTEPRWRERESRPRRNSIDRTGVSRERPASMLVDPSSLYEPRNSKDSGPPLSTRGWDKLHDGLGRTRSMRDGPRVVAQSPSRGRAAPYHDARDPYYVPPRMGSSDRHRSYPNDAAYDQYDYDDRWEPPRRERRGSVTRAADRSVERRGFGIRPESRDPPGHASEESFEQQKSYRDSGMIEPIRRDTANENRDRDYRRDDTYERDIDSRERDRHRDRDRERERDRDSDRERERTHRRDTERDHLRKEGTSRDANDNSTSSSSNLAKVATGGVATAAAALSLGKLASKDKSDGSDKERERDQDRDRDRDRVRESQRRYDEQQDGDRDRHTHSQESYSDHPPNAERDGGRSYHGQDSDRSLGFAFEITSDSQSAGANTTDRERERERHRDRDRDRERDRERERERERDRNQDRDPDRGYGDKPIEMPKPAVDADEDYRRRMEQVQRELGRSAEVKPNAEVDLDRERRRREREARQREREERNNMDGTAAAASAAAAAAYVATAPPEESSPPLGSLPRDYDNESDNTSLTSGLRRRPSILDMPMPVPAQIIDNSLSERKENRVRIVDPPTEEDEKRPKGILKKPTEKFPENLDVIREGVAPLKDSTKKGIPPGARWTKIDRRLVNPEALEEAKERYEERQDCVIVLRVLTKEDIQKLADRTKEIRDERYEEERAERRAARRRERHQDRQDRDEYSEDSDLEFQPRPPKMLEAPPSMAGSWPQGAPPSSSTSQAIPSDVGTDYTRERRRE